MIVWRDNLLALRFRISHLGSIFGLVLVSGRREEVGGELARFAHVALNLHFALHEGDLGVQLSKADLLEVGVGHSESCVSLGRLALLALSLSIFEVNFVDERRLGTLFGRNLESKHSVNLGNQSLAESLLKILAHHVENAFRFESTRGLFGGG